MGVFIPNCIDAEAFFRLAETRYRLELINEKVMRMPAPTPQHQRLVFKRFPTVRSSARLMRCI